MTPTKHLKTFVGMIPRFFIFGMISRPTPVMFLHGACSAKVFLCLCAFCVSMSGHGKTVASATPYSCASGQAYRPPILLENP